MQKMHRIGKNSEVKFMQDISDITRRSILNKERFVQIHNYYDTELLRSRQAISPPLVLPMVRYQST